MRLADRPLAAILAGLGALVGVACQPLDRPFAHGDAAPANPLLKPADGTGVLVAPMAGPPDLMGDELAAAMAAALRDADVPAATDAGNRASYRLVPRLTRQRIDEVRDFVSISWDLEAPDGSPVGSYVESRSIDRQDWVAASPALLDELAAPAAPAIARLLRGEQPTVVETLPPKVAVQLVTGAPGDGDRALSRAMRAGLDAAGFAVVDETGDPEILVAGLVAVRPEPPDSDRVQIAWLVRNGAGEELGVVDLDNTVPSGKLDRNWGETAYIAAQAGVSGILNLLQELDRRAPNRTGG